MVCADWMNCTNLGLSRRVWKHWEDFVNVLGLWKAADHGHFSCYSAQLVKNCRHALLVVGNVDVNSSLVPKDLLEAAWLLDTLNPVLRYLLTCIETANQLSNLSIGNPIVFFFNPVNLLSFCTLRCHNVLEYGWAYHNISDTILYYPSLFSAYFLQCIAENLAMIVTNTCYGSNFRLANIRCI